MIQYTYTEQDKKELVKSIPFHIERTIDVETETSKGSFLFNDDLLLESPLEEIIDIVLYKTPLNSSNNYDLGIIRDPGKKDVPSMFQTNNFWQTFFKHAMGSLYNELILYSYNRLKFPYVNEISLLYDNIFYDYENSAKSIAFEKTFENEEISNTKLDSMSNIIDYKTPQVELIDYWLTHLVASGGIKESEKQTETVLYRAQDLSNELIRRKVAGSLIGYLTLLNSVNVTGTLYPALPIAADENSLDPRLTRGINLPGITTIIPSIDVLPSEVFPEVPSGILNPSYYHSIDYNQDNFIVNPSSYLRFKNKNVVWDNLAGIVDISLVKVAYARLDKTPVDYLDVNGIQTEPVFLDTKTPLFNFSVSSETFLDIQANKIYNIQNTLQVKKRELYPYYIDTVAQNFGPVLSDIPWLSYVKKFIDEKKRVSEEVKVGMQLSLLDTSEENYVIIRELAFTYKDELSSEIEDYEYDSNVHNYMFIYSIEIQYHRSTFLVRANFPRKTLMTVVYLKQPAESAELIGKKLYDEVTSYSVGLLPFKYDDIQSGSIPNYTLLIDESDVEEPVKDYVEEAGYGKAYFFFMKNEHERLLIKDTITLASDLLNDVGENFSEFPFTLNNFYFIYGYEHENKIAYWSQMLNITRLDYLMELTEVRPDWHENILYINPQLNFNPPNCTSVETEGAFLQSLSDVHGYNVYNNDNDFPTADRTTAGQPQGFYLYKYRNVLNNDIVDETFQIWGDYRNVREEYTLTVTSDVTADENVSIILDSATAVDVAVLESDDADGVAAKINAATFPGWVTQIDPLANNKVIFTKTGGIVQTTGTYSVTAGTTATTFIKTTDLGDPLDDDIESIYRNVVQTDSFGINNLYLNNGQAYVRGDSIDTYYDVVSSTVISSESDKPLWYWNRTEAYEGMTFFAKIMFSENGLIASGASTDLPSSDNQWLLTRAERTGTSTDAGDEFEIYYDQPNSKFVFKVYPTGYSIDDAASNHLGQLIFEVDLPWVMSTSLPIRVGFTYKFDEVVDQPLQKKVVMSIIVDGESAEQTYIVTQTATSGSPTAGASTFTATYTVYDENNSIYLQVDSSNDIVLDDSVFNYNERYSAGSWQHFLGMLHKDAGQSNYSAEEINLFHNNTKYPFMGNVYDIRLHTSGFSERELQLYNKGTRREILSINIDSVKVYNHFAGDFALGKRIDDSSSNIIDNIRAFDRSKWNSILVDPQAISEGETTGINDRYNSQVANPLIDRDVYVYEGTAPEDLENPDPADYDDAEGVIKSFLKNNLEVISGFLWDPTYNLYYKGTNINADGIMFDLIQTTLYPIVYEDLPIINNPDLVLDGSSLKAYNTDTGYEPTGCSSVIKIDTTPSGDTLVYKCDISPYFKMNHNSFTSRSLYKGNKLQHHIDSTLNDISVELSESVEPPTNLSKLLIMPLNVPSQNPSGAVDNTHLNAISLKGLKLNNFLQKLIDPSSYYQEYLYPYDTGYRVDVVRSIKEGVYFVPIKIPILIEANYNTTKKKVFKNIETLLKIEVVGDIVDNSSTITDQTILDYYDMSSSEVEISKMPIDENGISLYRQITIKAYYYKNSNSTWSWQQILSNDETDITGDAELAYDVDEPTITKDIEFYLSDKIDMDEFFDWDTDTFVDRVNEPSARIPIYDMYSTNPVDTIFLKENSSYLLYLNLKSVTSSVKFSSDIACEPFNSKLFENVNYQNTIELLNDRLSALNISNSSINAGFSIDSLTFEAVDTVNGILGDPYANNKDNYLLNDLDENFIDSNVYTMKYVSFYSGVEALDSFPVGFFEDNKENVTLLYNSDGDLLQYNINEKEALSSHYNSHKLQSIAEAVKGLYSITPVIDASPISATTEINIAADSQLYTHQLSLFARTVPKWLAESKTYDEFKLYKDIYYSKIKQLGESYSSKYYFEYEYTSAGSYSITFNEKDMYDKAYVLVNLSLAATINGIAVSATTDTWLTVDITAAGVLTLTSDTATVMNILNIKPYTLSTTSVSYKRFLTAQDNSGQRFATIKEQPTFIYLSDDTEARKWFIQFKSSYQEGSLSSDPAFTSYNGYLKDFININLDLKTNTVKNPWIHTFVYKEDGDEIKVYIKNELLENSPDNLIYIDYMHYNAPKNTIDIGGDTEDGIFLNATPLQFTNLDLAEDVLIFNEKMTSIANCINPSKIQKKESSVNAITNVQLLAADKIVYEFEIPPLIYDELTQHISFNILMGR